MDGFISPMGRIFLATPFKARRCSSTKVPTLCPVMIGTILNVAGILLGGAVGLIRRRPLSAAAESYFKVTLAAITVFYGLRLTWVGLNGSFLQMLKQLL